MHVAFHASSIFSNFHFQTHTQEYATLSYDSPTIAISRASDPSSTQNQDPGVQVLNCLCLDPSYIIYMTEEEKMKDCSQRKVYHATSAPRVQDEKDAHS